MNVSFQLRWLNDESQCISPQHRAAPEHAGTWPGLKRTRQLFKKDFPPQASWEGSFTRLCKSDTVFAVELVTVPLQHSLWHVGGENLLHQMTQTRSSILMPKTSKETGSVLQRHRRVRVWTYKLPSPELNRQLEILIRFARLTWCKQKNQMPFTLKW